MGLKNWGLRGGISQRNLSHYNTSNSELARNRPKRYIQLLNIGSIVSKNWLWPQVTPILGGGLWINSVFPIGSRQLSLCYAKCTPRHKSIHWVASIPQPQVHVLMTVAICLINSSLSEGQSLSIMEVKADTDVTFPPLGHGAWMPSSGTQRSRQHGPRPPRWNRTDFQFAQREFYRLHSAPVRSDSSASSRRALLMQSLPP